MCIYGCSDKEPPKDRLIKQSTIELTVCEDTTTVINTNPVLIQYRSSMRGALKMDNCARGCDLFIIEPNGKVTRDDNPTYEPAIRYSKKMPEKEFSRLNDLISKTKIFDVDLKETINSIKISGGGNAQLIFMSGKDISIIGYGINQRFCERFEEIRYEVLRIRDLSEKGVKEYDTKK